MPVRACRSAYMLSNDMNPAHEILHTAHGKRAASAASRRVTVRLRSFPPSLAPRESCPEQPMLRGAADVQAADLERRLPHTDRNTLSILAADAHAAVEFQVVSHHRHPGERIRTVADERRTLDRIRELALLDLPCLRGREHELPARDVDLTAAEVGGVNAVADR